MEMTDHKIKLDLALTIEWEEDDRHCEEGDPYPIRKPISAAYALGGGHVVHYYFNMIPENAIEEAIVDAIREGSIS